MNVIVCTIPKKCILSPKNCIIGNILETEEIEGTLALTVCLLYERSIGDDSFWSFTTSIFKFKKQLI